MNGERGSIDRRLAAAVHLVGAQRIVMKHLEAERDALIIELIKAGATTRAAAVAGQVKESHVKILRQRITVARRGAANR